MSITLDSMERQIFKPGYLSPKQKQVVTHVGNGVVRACPGSGKTKSLNARLAYHMAGWDSYRQGIAALSFTNVAAEEIKSGLRDLGLDNPNGVPHFVGTIDSFVYQHLTGPHASILFPGAGRRIELIADKVTSDWLARRKQLCFPYLSGGKLIANVCITECDFMLGKQYTWPHRQSHLKKPSWEQVLIKKKVCGNMGYMTHTDSIYYALVLLTKYPQLAKALAWRYPEIVIDEAQDTGDLQNRIISLLAATGLTTILLVGDPLQAIYEWRRAKPQLMLDRIERDGWEEIKLDDNYRSSRHICDSVCSLFKTGGKMIAIGQDAACTLAPIVLRYDDEDVGSLPRYFKSIIAATNGPCDFKKVKVVARSRRGIGELRRLAGADDVNASSSVRNLIQASHSHGMGAWQESVRHAETTLCRIVLNRGSLGPMREGLGDMPYRTWRGLVWSVVSALPNPQRDLGDWIADSRQIIQSAFADLGITPAKEISDVIRKPANCPSIPALNVINPSGDVDGVGIDTVHQVKGQTLDGIMLVASPKVRRRKSSVYQWLEGIQSNTIEEEQRIVYVALTRPSKLLVVAIPDSAWDDCSGAFAGFVPAKTDDIGLLSDLCEGCSKLTA